MLLFAPSPPSATSQEFGKSEDVSLFIHTHTYPHLDFSRKTIMAEINGFINKNIVTTLLKRLKGGDLPHIHVIGKHMSNMEMIRL